MTIEATSAGHGVAKPAQTATNGKGKGAPIAGDASGFFAMLSAADDALAVSADTSGLLSDGGGALPGAALQDEDELACAADATALAGWVLGMPVPAAQGAPASEERSAAQQGNAFFGVKRSSWSASATEGAPTTGLLTAGHKSAKPASTADLQKIQTIPFPGPLPADDAAASTSMGKETLPVQELAPSVGMEGRTLVAPASGQVPVVERRLWEPLVAKSAPAEGGYFQPQSVSAPMGMDGVVATQASGSIESYVTEQVTYWIAQDVQSAELTLDGLGMSPVEVSISMQGNEAQVAFRTDEIHARDAIESAAEQLKDSLQRQGVVLTGMSVGTSHSGDASGQGGRPRQEGRQAGLTVQVQALTDSPTRPKIPQGRALDLYV